MTYKVTPRETVDIVRATRTTTKSSGFKTWSSLPTQLARTNTERVTDGQNTPGYFKVKRRGGILPYTDFFQYEAETISRSYSNRWETTTKVTDVTVGSGSDTIQDEYEITEYGASYGLELLKDVDGGAYLQDAAAAIMGQGMDALTFVAELHKTRQMFFNILQRLRKLISNPRDIDHLASLWLEGRYGWRTLRFDLMDLNDALRNFDTSRRRFTERRGTTYSYTVRSQSDATTGAGTYTLYRDESVEIGVRGSVTADIAPAKFRASLLTTAWETYPLSFVWDWLFTVGSALESAQFLLQVENYAAGTGIKAGANVEFTVGNLRPSAGINSWDFTRSQTERGEWIYRKPARVSINPKSRIKLDVWKGLDALALLRQQYVKLKARRR